MSSLPSLWLPILVSSVAVFLLSSILHMVLPWHKGDYPTLPNEAGVMDALRPFNIPPGEYMAPRGNMKSQEFLDKVSRGPVFILNMFPNGMTSMGKLLGLWFVYIVVVNASAGHIGQIAMHEQMNPSHIDIMHSVGLIAFMGYAAALWQGVIWFRRPWKVALKSTIDGLLYGFATGLVFIWLWPK